jgi:Bacterial toxin 8
VQAQLTPEDYRRFNENIRRFGEELPFRAMAATSPTAALNYLVVNPLLQSLWETYGPKKEAAADEDSLTAAADEYTTHTISGPGTPGAGAAMPGNGRAGRQQRLRDLVNDPNTSSADRGWIKQEMNAIDRGAREAIRNPPGKELAHAPGREAAKGYDHVASPSALQDKDLHRARHKIDDFGRANKERP